MPEQYKGGLSSILDDDALRCLQSYEWPGNVRELENVIERACIMRDTDRIRVEDLPLPMHGRGGGTAAMPSTLVGGMVSLEDLERAHNLQVLEAVGWQKKRAAEILEINPSTLYRKLLRYGVGQDEDEAMDLDQELAAAPAAGQQDDLDEAERMFDAVDALSGAPDVPAPVGVE
ncbi:MAG: helix-turn-helix domain-containing protein [Candidatus Krumholzibacteriia bacterium]